MFISSLLSFAESNTVDDRGVIEGITNNSVFRTEYSLEEACVCIKTAGEENAILQAIVVGYSFL